MNRWHCDTTWLPHDETISIFSSDNVMYIYIYILIWVYDSLCGLSSASRLKFTYFGSSESSTEKDINTQLIKAWTAIDRLSVIWKSELSDKIKRNHFHVVVSILLYGCTTIDADKAYWEKAWQQLHKNAKSYIELKLEAPSHKTAAVQPPIPHLLNHRNQTDKTCRTLLKK